MKGLSRFWSLNSMSDHAAGKGTRLVKRKPRLLWSIMLKIHCTKLFLWCSFCVFDEHPWKKKKKTSFISLVILKIILMWPCFITIASYLMKISVWKYKYLIPLTWNGYYGSGCIHIQVHPEPSPALENHGDWLWHLGMRWELQALLLAMAWFICVFLSQAGAAMFSSTWVIHTEI